MSKQDTILFDQVVISQKRSIYIKLRSFTTEQYGESTFIELQEVKKAQSGNTYSTPLRIPASEKSILLAELIRDFTLEYRRLRNKQKFSGINSHSEQNTQNGDVHNSKNSNNNSNDIEITNISPNELSVLIFENFKGKNVIKSNINNFLVDNKIKGNTTEALGLLQQENKVIFEEKVSKSGNKYHLWSFLS